MTYRFVKPLALAALVTLPLVAAKFGGWSIVTIRDVPEYAVAGKPIELSFVVRQHGIGGMAGLMPKITATSGSTVVKSLGLDVGEGNYTGRVVVPTAGTWKINI